MRSYCLKLAGILVVGLFSNVGLQAQDQQQLLNEMRMLEEYAQEQAAYQAQQQSQHYSHAQNSVQNVSVSQPQRQVPAPASMAPDREDLFDAANAGNIQQIGRLLSQGLDVNLTNNQRETALHMAAARGHYEAVIFLVRNGAYVKAPTVKNWIPLHHAVRFRHPNIVSFLLEKGSSPHARTTDGLSAIDMAKSHRDNRMLALMGAR